MEYSKDVAEHSAAPPCSLVSWDEAGSQWFVAWRDGKPVSAFRFESDEVHRTRTWDDQQRTPLGMWSAWVPGENGSKLITWPDGTSIQQMKSDLIAADCRLH